MLSPQYGMRTDAKVDKEVLILTDGQSNCGGDVFAAAANLQKKARVFALVIGNATEEGLEEMANYVSQPIPDHLFSIKNFREFDGLVQAVQQEIQKSACVPLDLN